MSALPYFLSTPTKTFPDPYPYNIERWVNEDEESIKKRTHVFLPFALGERVKVLVGNVKVNFKFRVTSPVRPRWFDLPTKVSMCCLVEEVWDPTLVFLKLKYQENPVVYLLRVSWYPSSATAVTL